MEADLKERNRRVDAARDEHYNRREAALHEHYQIREADLLERNKSMEAALLASACAALSVVVVDGAGALRDVLDCRMGLMTAAVYSERFTVRCGNFLRNLVGSCGGAALGALFLTPAIGPFFAPALGGIVGSTVAALFNGRLYAVKAGPRDT
jgi:hypothetical protein